MIERWVRLVIGEHPGKILTSGDYTAGFAFTIAYGVALTAGILIVAMLVIGTNGWILLPFGILSIMGLSFYMSYKRQRNV